MPILWRFLIRIFLKITTATVIAFIAILLTMRLDDIAHFAGLGAPVTQLVAYAAYQIPYILPIALPLSCLIAASLLIQKLSSSHELTAMRACGISLYHILQPILLTALFLSIVNFWITSEMATHCHLQSNKLKSELRAINPLLLLQNKHLMRLKGFYFHILGTSHIGESAEETILALPNNHKQRIQLMVAKELQVTPQLFTGENVTFITAAPSTLEEDFDHLLIENMQKSLTQTSHFSDLLQNKTWSVHNDYLQLPLLINKINEQKLLLQGRKTNTLSHAIWKQHQKEYNKSLSEIIKRCSIAIAVFSFTLMGSAFAINIGRRKPFFPLVIVLGLTTFYLIAFFVAKATDHNFWLSTALYLGPHVIIITASLLFLRRMNRGIEIC